MVELNLASNQLTGIPEAVSDRVSGGGSENYIKKNTQNKLPQGPGLLRRIRELNGREDELGPLPEEIACLP